MAEMDPDDPLARIARLEAEVARLSAALDTAQGEANFAGLLAPMLLTIMVQGGLLPRETARDFLDHLLLVMEREQGKLPGAKGVFEHTRSRIEATLRPFLSAPPATR